jgi:hypothetical protein
MRPALLALVLIGCSADAPRPTSPGAPASQPKPPGGVRRPEPRNIPVPPADWEPMEERELGFGVRVPFGTERRPPGQPIPQAAKHPLAAKLPQPRDVIFEVATFRGKGFLPDDLENLAKTVATANGGENPSLKGCERDRAGFTICDVEFDDPSGGRKGCATLASDGADQYVLVATAGRTHDIDVGFARLVCASLYLF